jgi:hypothetical protein
LDEGGDTKLEEYMLSQQHIYEIIKSRPDLSANRTDGIGYHITKAAKKVGVQFMKLLVGADIRNGRILSSWKEARAILLHKKGDREQVRNWRAVSIANCVYRVFTCLMARSWQAINAKARLYSDVQKGFVKATNGCSEHAIILNELFEGANR